MHAHTIHCTVAGAHEKRAQHFSWAPDSSLEMNDEANNKCCTKIMQTACTCIGQ